MKIDHIEKVTSDTYTLYENTRSPGLHLYEDGGNICNDFYGELLKEIERLSNRIAQLKELQSNICLAQSSQTNNIKLFYLIKPYDRKYSYVDQAGLEYGYNFLNDTPILISYDFQIYKILGLYNTIDFTKKSIWSKTIRPIVTKVVVAEKAVSEEGADK